MSVALESFWWQKSKIVEVAADEMSAIVARGLDALGAGKTGEALPLPKTRLPAGCRVWGIKQYDDGRFALKVYHPDWPPKAEGACYEKLS